MSPLPQVPQAQLGSATHAAAAKGKVGIALNIEYLEPLTQVGLVHGVSHVCYK